MSKTERRAKIWSLEALIQGEFVQLGRGKVISKIDLADTPGTFPVYSSAKDGDGKFGEYGKYLFDEELITWSVDGGGRLFHRPKHKFSVTNVGGFLRILRLDFISYRYLYYALTFEHSKISFDWVKKAHPSTLRKEYNNIPIPPLPEQKRIVAILDEAFEGVDRAIANTEKNLANAREVFESYLNSIFTEKSERWAEKRLEDTVEETCSLSYGIVQPGEDVDGGLPIVRPTDLKTQYIYLDGLKRINPALAEGYRRTTLSGGELLLCVRGGTGSVAIAAEELAGSNVTRGIVPIRFNPAIVLQDFGYFAFRSKVVQDQVKAATYGAALMQINIRDLRKINLGFPPLGVQKGLLKNFGHLLTEVERLASIYERKVASLAELKQAILQKTFAGELTARSVEDLHEAAQ